MVTQSEFVSIICVGALWGCSTPLMRKGLKDTTQSSPSTSTTLNVDDNIQHEDSNEHEMNKVLWNDKIQHLSMSLNSTSHMSSTIYGSIQSSSSLSDPLVESPSGIQRKNNHFIHQIKEALYQFRHPSVFLPYLMNQSSCIFYYKLAATSDMTVSLPACSTMALLFSSFTGYLLGERLDNPIRGLLGCLMVTLGVFICMFSEELEKRIVF